MSKKKTENEKIWEEMPASLACRHDLDWQTKLSIYLSIKDEMSRKRKLQKLMREEDEICWENDNG